MLYILNEISYITKKKRLTVQDSRIGEEWEIPDQGARKLW